MELFQNDEDPGDTEQLLYDKVEDFKYLVATLSTRNDWPWEIGIWISKAEKVFFVLAKLFRSKTISRNAKVSLYVAIIRPTLTYGYEIWITTKQTKKRLRTFENKSWKRICSLINDVATDSWRRKYNRELYDIVGVAPVTS